MEIERKFLLKQLPNLPIQTEMDVYQGYLSFDPEVRIRAREWRSAPFQGKQDYFLTIKGKGDLVREELERTMDAAFFQEASKLVIGPIIHKHYFRYHYDGYVLECSVVDEGTPTSFIYGEVEFDDVESAQQFVWPFPDAQEITYNPQYKMAHYCQIRKQSEVNTPHG